MSPSEETIFLEALSFTAADSREAFLLKACEGQAELLANVRSLLDGYARGEFLEHTLPTVAEMRLQAMSDSPIKMIGPYHIRELIGRGGMGSVYMAEQLQPVRRKVAVKVIRPGLENQDVIRRFHQEQRTLAMMDHPCIARVLDASITETGVSYFVMELVSGVPILEYCETAAIDIEQRLRLIIDCCHAIQHAHQKGVIHRDIKPSNVLVTVLDQKPVVKVIDFGIAKAFEGEATERTSSGRTYITQLGEFLGTPQYMSPEQASMGEIPIDTRADIYSLGTLLYAMLTGVPPFDTARIKRATFDEIRQIIRDEDPLLPSVRIRQRKSDGDTLRTSDSTRRRLVNQLNGDLDCIIMKAMEKVPDRRYQSVGELIDDVQCFLDSKPIQARPPTAFYTLSKLARRRQRLLISVALAMTCLLTGLVFAIIQARRAISAEQRMAQLLYVADMRVATQATIRGDSVEARKALERYRPAADKDDLRSFDWYFLAAQNKVERRDLLTCENPLYHLCRIHGTSHMATCGADGVIQIFEESSGRLLQSIKAEQGEVNGLGCSPDGKILASAGDDGTIAFWDSKTGKAMHRFKAHQRQAFQIAWSPDSTQLATCGNEKNVHIWSYPELREICVFPTDDDLECLAVSQNGDLAFGAEGGLVTVTKFPTEAGTIPSVRTFWDVAKEHCSTLAFSQDSQLLAAGQNHGRVVIQPLAVESQGDAVEFLLSDSVTCLAFIGNTHQLAGGLQDGTLFTIDPEQRTSPGFSLRTVSWLTDGAGNILDGDNDGGAGGLWDSQNSPAFAYADSDRIAAVRKENAAVGHSPDTEPPRLLRVTPPLVNGLIPPDARQVTLEFSEPVVGLTPVPHNFVLHYVDLATDIREETAIQSVEKRDAGATVTLTFSRDGADAPAPAARMKPKTQWKSNPLHHGAANALLVSASGNEIISAGADGRVIESLHRRVDFAQPSSHLPNHTLFDASGNLLIRNQRESRYSVIPADDVRARSSDWPTSEDGPSMYLPVMAGQTGACFSGDHNDGEKFNRRIVRWSGDLKSSETVWSAKPEEAASLRAVSSDERFLAMIVIETTKAVDGGSKDIGWIVVLDLKQKREIGRQLCGTIFDIEFSPDNRTLGYITQGGLVLADAFTGKIIRSLSDPVSSFAFSIDGEELATVSENRMLTIWRVADGVQLESVQAHGVAARGVAYTPDGKTIATIGSDGVFRCWRREAMEMTMELPFGSRLDHLQFSPQGDVAALQDHQGRLFLLRADQSVARFTRN